MHCKTASLPAAAETAQGSPPRRRRLSVQHNIWVPRVPCPSRTTHTRPYCNLQYRNIAKRRASETGEAGRGLVRQNWSCYSDLFLLELRENLPTNPSLHRLNPKPQRCNSSIRVENEPGASFVVTVVSSGRCRSRCVGSGDSCPTHPLHSPYMRLFVLASRRRRERERCCVTAMGFWGRRNFPEVFT